MPIVLAIRCTVWILLINLHDRSRIETVNALQRGVVASLVPAVRWLDWAAGPPKPLRV